MLHVDATHCQQSMTHLQVLKNLLSAGVVKVVAGGSGTHKNVIFSRRLLHTLLELPLQHSEKRN